MKRLELLLIIFAMIVGQELSAQTKEYCVHCNMIIGDDLHKAQAVLEGKNLDFDAIECLFNFLKKEADLTEMKVIDYTSGEYADAISSYYLKSKGIPSPMGANLSAFKSKNEAEKMKVLKGGEIYNWDQLKKRFEESDFGDINGDHHHQHSRPDSHAPIGVMGDHLHHKGGLMLSFRYMGMNMNGLRDKGGMVDDEKIYDDYMVAPQSMDMHMYMIGVMYAPTDRLTLMAMQNIVENNMNLNARMRMMMNMGSQMGGMMNGMMETRTMEREFSTSSNGFGDLKLSALVGLVQKKNSSLHLNSTVSFPLGSIKEKGDTPMNEDIKLPYKMQLGSGTYDYSFGATYKRIYNKFSLGCQLIGTLRTGKNTERYRLGNYAIGNLWGAYLLSKKFSLSARVQGAIEDKIQGSDPDLNPMMATPANPNNYGGEYLRSFLGVNFAFNEGSYWSRFRLGAEAGVPLAQEVNGYQMNEEYSFTLGLKYSIL